MFLLSIIPIGLNGGPKEVPKDDVLKKESEIKDLEACLTSGLLGEDPACGLGDYSINPNGMSPEQYQEQTEREHKECEERKAELAKETGINLSDLGEIQKGIEKLRQEELTLIEQSGHPHNPNDSDSATKRLSDIQGRMAAGEERLHDLNGLKDALTQGKPFDADLYLPGNQPVSGLNTALHPNGAEDINIVDQEIHRTEAYEKVLKDAQGFWAKIADYEIDVSSKGSSESVPDPSKTKNIPSSEKLGNLELDKAKSVTTEKHLEMHPADEANPFDIKNFGAGIGMLLGDDLKPGMTEKEFRETVVKDLEMQTGIHPNPSRVAAINTFITAIKNGISVPGYKGDGRTQFAYLLNLWKYPNQPLPRR